MIDDEYSDLEIELLDICKKNQGQYLKANHPRTSWATTYSDSFIEAAKQLYLIYKNRYTHSSELWVFILTSQALQNAGVKSCRGSAMTTDRFIYLFNAHIEGKI